MKKIILSVLCVGIATASFAQKNSLLLTGGGTLSSGTNDVAGATTSRSLFEINPGVGYQFSTNWTLGVELMYNYTSNSLPAPTGGTVKSSTMVYGGGIFARYTIPLTNIFYFYAQADVTDGMGSSYDNSGKKIPGSDQNMFRARITPAIGMNIKNGYSLNFGFGNVDFASTTTSATPSSSSSAVSVNLQAFSFGISKNFLHKEKKKAKKDTTAEGADNE